MLTTTNRIPRVILGMLLAMSLALAEGKSMDGKIQKKIAEAAHTEYGWKLDQIRVDELEGLRRPTCSFYTAGNAVRPLSYEGNYALLPGNHVVGIGDEQAASKILDTCSEGTSANWWAEIITRFTGDLGGGLVLSDENERPDIVRKLAGAGLKFTAPTFGENKSSVSFLLLDAEHYILYRVEAKRAADGKVEVAKTRVLGGPAQNSPADSVDSISEMLR